MPAIPIPGGLSNKEIIDQAYTVLGLSDAMFGRTDEEYASGASFLRGMMEEWPYNLLGFDSGGGKVSDESGVDKKYLTVLSHELAIRVGSSNNKGLKPGPAKTYARAYARLCGEVALITEVGHALKTPVGAGHRGWMRSTFFSDGA